MMKKLYYGMAMATFATMMLIVSGAAASSPQMPGGMPASSEPAQGKMPQHQQGMMDMPAMMKGPHHLLAMAYKDNLVNFAKALRQDAGQTKPVNTEFARAAVAEMKRSFEQMQLHHQAQMRMTDDKMKTQMAGMTKQMDEQHAALQEHLTALDKEVQSSAPATKNIDMHVAEILKHCEGMSMMDAGMKTHKME